MQRHTPPHPTRRPPRQRRNTALADTDGTLALLAFLALVLNHSPPPR
jgi:hypothetical protein